MLILAVIAGLFAWSIGSGKGPDSHLYVSMLPGSLAAIAFVITLVSYFAVKRNFYQSLLINYILLTATGWLLVFASSNQGAPHLALFAAIIAVGPLLGTYGLLTAVIAAAAAVAERFIIEQTPLGSLAALAMMLFTPLLAASLLWLRRHQSVGASEPICESLATVAGPQASDIVISAIGDGVVAVNAKGIITLINPAAQQLVGWGNQDAIGLSYKSVIRLMDQDNNTIKDNDNGDIIARVLNTNNPLKTDDFKIKTQSDKNFMASISVKPISNKHNDGAVIVFRDITAERSDERQRAEFISTASHEMRTPVASIEGYLGLALNPQTATIDTRARGYITKAHQSAEHLGRLFQDLLDISKADDHRLSNNPKIVNVIDFIKDIADGLTPKAEEKGLSVNFVPSTSDVSSKEVQNRRINPILYANVDNDHLREIVQNLIENAIKYTPSGSITVDVTSNNDQVTISVADTGIGIPPEDVGHLFQKFYRVDNSDTRQIGGTGLGLYLCRRLAETIGGRLWVESEYQHGSTFFLAIPRVDHVAATFLNDNGETENNASIDKLSAEDMLASNAPEILAVAPAAAEFEQTPLDTPTPTAPTQTFTDTSLLNYSPPPAPKPDDLNQNAASTTKQFTNTPLSDIEAAPDKYAEQLRNEIRLNVPPRRN